MLPPGMKLRRAIYGKLAEMQNDRVAFAYTILYHLLARTKKQGIQL